MGRGYNFKPVEELCFSDDFMFGAVMKEPGICKGVIEKLLHIKVDHIEYPELQKVISPFYSRKGIRLDVYVADSDKIFDIEMQTYNMDCAGRRLRYYQSMIDVDNLVKGVDYSELKESYIIFLCLTDPFEKDLPVYTFERVCRECGEVNLEDATHHVIYNCSAFDKEKDGELKSLLEFVKSNKVQDEFTKEIAEMVQTKKFQQSFVNEYMAWSLHDRDVERRGREEGLAEGMQKGLAEGMQKGLTEGMQKGLTEGMQKGKVQAMLENARNMMSALGLTKEQAMDILKVSGDDRKILSQML